MVNCSKESFRLLGYIFLRLLQKLSGFCAGFDNKFLKYSCFTFLKRLFTMFLLRLCSTLCVGRLDVLYLCCSLSPSAIFCFKSGVIQGHGFSRIRFVIIGATLSKHDLMMSLTLFQATFTLVPVSTACQFEFLSLPQNNSLL